MVLGHIVDPEATLGGEPGVAAPSPSAVDGYFGAVGARAPTGQELSCGEEVLS